MGMAKIDLKNFEGRVLSGRNRGQLARQKFSLEEFDQDPDIQVDVKVPDSIRIITSSFFLGLFGPSILRLGSKDAFKQKFHIQATSGIEQDADRYIDLALQRRSLFSDPKH
jgi:hypothetical protein